MPIQRVIHRSTMQRETPTPPAGNPPPDIEPAVNCQVRAFSSARPILAILKSNTGRRPAEGGDAGEYHELPGVGGNPPPGDGQDSCAVGLGLLAVERDHGEDA